MRTSKRVAIEAALDYRTELSEDGARRVRERPLQGSLLVFPVRSVVSPYLLAGIGRYTQWTDVVDLTGQTLETTEETTTGSHLGFGAELFFGRNAAFFLDYRYRFVKFGEPEPGAQPIDLPGLDQLSHRGSMWTSGMAFYF
jgi:hypothetical protein